MTDASEKNEQLLKVLDKNVAVIPCTDGWVFKFDFDTLQSLLDEAIESGENAAFVFVKIPPAN